MPSCLSSQRRATVASLAVAVGLLLAATGLQARILEIADTFSVNINSSGAGTFGEITLYGQAFDLGQEVQRQFILGSELTNDSTVTILSSPKPTARYTASVDGQPELDVVVETVLHGALRDSATRRNMFMTQDFTVTNGGSTAVDIDSVSFFVPAFYTNTDAGGDETVQADASRGIIYATDGATTRFAAVGVNVTDSYVISYDVGEELTLPWPALAKDDLTDYPGPVQASDDPDDGFITEMALGTWTNPTLAPGDSVTLQFAYLFSLNDSVPPPSFPAPVPPTPWLMLGFVPLLLRSRARGSAPAR